MRSAQTQRRWSSTRRRSPVCACWRSVSNSAWSKSRRGGSCAANGMALLLLARRDVTVVDLLELPFGVVEGALDAHLLLIDVQHRLVQDLAHVVAAGNGRPHVAEGEQVDELLDDRLLRQEALVVCAVLAGLGHGMPRSVVAW